MKRERRQRINHLNDMQDLILVGLAASQISFVRRPQLYSGSTQPAPLPRLTLVVLCNEVTNSSSVQVNSLRFGTYGHSASVLLTFGRYMM